MKSFFFLILTIFLPLFAFGEAKISNIIYEVHTVAFLVIKFLIAAATAVFIWGVIKYIFLSGGDTKKAEEAKQFILWGAIGLFAIVAMWGLVLVLQRTFDLGPVPDNPNKDILLPNWSDIPR